MQLLLNHWISRVIHRYTDRFLSRWITLIFDTCLVYGSYILTVIIRNNFVYTSIIDLKYDVISLIITAIYFSGFLIGKTYHGILRHTGLTDIGRISAVNTIVFIILVSLSVLSLQLRIKPNYISTFGILVVHYVMTTFFMVVSRLAIRTIYRKYKIVNGRQRINILIYGAGEAGLLVLNALRQDKLYENNVICFIDDNESKVNKRLDGIPVYSAEKVLTYEFVSRNRISQLIIAIRDLDHNKKQEIVDTAINLKLKVKTVPPVYKWIDGQLTVKQLRQIRIEELLGRDPIILEKDNINNFIANQIILITGAAGSIGSEIARQVLEYKPARLILIDQAETPIYELQNELLSNPRYSSVISKTVFLIANVKDSFRMRKIFSTYRPDIVFHGAAYKHVPLMEENPYEAVWVNVFGTRIIADLSVEYNVRKFIMVSTDKAVNPTNVMGATKRIAEIYIQTLSKGKTQFITTRFGNVLGSNGSVIPIFRKQIEKGGPVTITHKDIIRYFMTISEACNLVLEAGAMGNGGEIFVFDMGNPVRIYDLAIKMIKLMGLKPGTDIQIIETGLRPGEKLFEELLSNDEYTVDTHHPKIRKARMNKYDENFVQRKLLELANALIEGDDFLLVKKMKELVPEFISNNSVFSKLDVIRDN